MVWGYIDDFGALFRENDMERACPKATEWLRRTKEAMRKAGGKKIRFAESQSVLVRRPLSPELKT